MLDLNQNQVFKLSVLPGPGALALVVLGNVGVSPLSFMIHVFVV